MIGLGVIDETWADGCTFACILMRETEAVCVCVCDSVIASTEESVKNANLPTAE